MDGYGSKYGSIKTIIAEAKKVYTWVDRTKIYNCLKTTKRKAKARENDESATQAVLEECVVATRKSSGGRPKGSTARAKQNLKEMKKRAIDEVASSYLKEKEKNGGKVPNGAFKTVYEEKGKSQGKRRKRHTSRLGRMCCGHPKVIRRPP